MCSIEYIVNLRNIICHIIRQSCNIHCNPLKFAKFTYSCKFMLIYANIFKSSDHLDTLHVEAYNTSHNL